MTKLKRITSRGGLVRLLLVLLFGGLLVWQVGRKPPKTGGAGVGTIALVEDRHSANDVGMLPRETTVGTPTVGRASPTVASVSGAASSKSADGRKVVVAKYERQNAEVPTGTEVKARMLSAMEWEHRCRTTGLVFDSAARIIVGADTSNPLPVAGSEHPHEGREFVSGVEYETTDGGCRRVWVVRDNGSKYSLIRIVEKETGAPIRIQTSLQEVVADHFVVKMAKGVRPDGVEMTKRLAEIGCSLRRCLPLSGCALVAFDGTDPLRFDEVQRKLVALDGIGQVACDSVVHISVTPNDTHFPLLWGMNNTGQEGGTPDADIDAAEAWDITTGSQNIIVGVIDTGVDYTHDDLKNNIWVNPGEIPGNGIDDDGNGYVDDVYGYDFYNNDGDPMDDNGHGTHCSGTIGAQGNNGTGAVGVNWSTRIMAIKFLNAKGEGFGSDNVEAIAYAVWMRNHGQNLRVLSNSYGYSGPQDQSLETQIRNADSAGILFVAAAGNSSTDNDVSPIWPCNSQSPNVLSVAASDRTDQMAAFSCYGVTTVHLAAPGVTIASTYPGNKYAYMSGTSMACPHVAGAAALILSINPGLDVKNLKLSILNSVDPVAAFAGKVITGGRLNVARAVARSAGPAYLTVDSVSTSEVGGPGDGVLNPGEALAMRLTIANMGVGTATGVVAYVSSTDPNVAFSDTTATVGNIAGSSTKAALDDIVFTVAAGVVTPYRASIDVTLRNATGTEWRANASVWVYRSSRITVRVLDAMNSSPVQGATIYYTGPRNLAGQTTTDVSGSWVLGPVGDGAYVFRAEKTGVFGMSAPQTSSVPPNGTVTIALDSPRLRVEPVSLNLTVRRGEKVETVLRLSNERTASLKWLLATSDGSVPGTVLRQLSTPACMRQAGWNPIARGEGCFWVAAGGASVFTFDKVDMDTLQTLQPAGSVIVESGVVPGGMGWDPDRKWLWVAYKYGSGTDIDNPKFRKVVAIDPVSWTIKRTLTVSTAPNRNMIQACEYVDGVLWTLGNESAQRIDPDTGAVTACVPYVGGNGGPWLLHATYYHGSLWGCGVSSMWGCCGNTRRWRLPDFPFTVNNVYESFYPTAGWGGFFAACDGRGAYYTGLLSTDTMLVVATGEAPWMDLSGRAAEGWAGTLTGLDYHDARLVIDARPDLVNEGVHHAKVIVTSNDESAPSVEVPVTLTVLPPLNQAPTITKGPAAVPVTVVAPGRVMLSVTATDPEGDTLSYSWGGDGPSSPEFDAPAASSTGVGLSSAGTYNLFVRVKDTYGNFTLGTVAVEVTADAPERDIFVRPASLSVSVTAGQTKTVPLVLANRGWHPSGLRWENVTESTGREKHAFAATASDIIGGMAFDGRYVYTVHYNPQVSVLRRFDPWQPYGRYGAGRKKELGATNPDARFAGIWDMAHDGEFLWVASQDGNVRALTVEWPTEELPPTDPREVLQGVTVRRVFSPASGKPICGVTVGGGSLWVMSGSVSDSLTPRRIYELDPVTGAQRKVYDVPADVQTYATPFNMAYVDDALCLSAFLPAASGLPAKMRVYRVRPADGQVINWFVPPLPSHGPTCYAIAGGGNHDLWTAEWGTFVGSELALGYARLFSVRDIPWLQRSPETGTNAPKAAIAQNLTFDARSLAVGTYQTTMAIRSDDRAHLVTLVPVTMQVLTSASQNNPPQSVNDGPYSVTRGGQLTVSTAQGVLSNDTDPENAPLTATVVVGVRQGTLSLSSDGSFVYTPNVGFSGDDTFWYAANDGQQFGAPAEVRVRVADAPVNLPPSNLTASSSGGKAVLTWSDNSTDETGFVLDRFANADLPAPVIRDDGTPGVTVSAGWTASSNVDWAYNKTCWSSMAAGPAVTYRPGFTGTMQAEVFLWGTPQANGIFQFSPCQVDVRRADGSAFSTVQRLDLTGQWYSIGVFAMDSDSFVQVKSTGLSFADAVKFVPVAPDWQTVATPVKNATVWTDTTVLVGQTYRYRVRADGAGVPWNWSNEAQVTVTSGGSSNRLPVAANMSVTTAEDTGKTVAMSASDPDGDALTYAIVTGPAHGSLGAVSGSNVVYTPAANYNGGDSFTYRASDGKTNSNVATVTITVTSVNDAPTCSITAPANGATFTAPATITIQANASDVDGTIAKVDFFNGATKLGEATTAPYQYIWTGVAAGSYTLTAKATDNSGAVTTASGVSVTVTGGNPDGLVAHWKLDETNGTAAADASGNGNTGSLKNGATWTAGKLTGGLNFNGINQYMDSGTYFPSLKQPFTIALWVNPATNQMQYADILGNHQGTGNGGMVLQQDGATLNSYSFAYSTGSGFQGVGPIQLTGNTWQHVAVVCDGINNIMYVNGIEKARAAGTGVMAPNSTQNFKLGQGYVSDRYFKGILDDARIYSRALSAGDVAALAAVATNRAPVAANVTVSTAEDTGRTVAMAASDADGDALTYTIVTGPAHGALGAVSGSNVVYTPAANYNGADSFTYRASDGKTNSNVATVSITVTPVNDAPTCSITSPANGATFTAPPSITIQANASDVDGTIAKVEFFNGATKLGEDATSPYEYAWTNVAAGSYALTVKATDNSGAVTTSAVVNVTVNPSGGPNGYIWCANEGGSYTFTQTVDVAYGAQGKFVYKYGVTGTIVFNNTTFGDPIGGVVKAGYYRIAIVSNNPPVAIAQSVTTAEDTAKAIVLTGSDPDGDPLTFAVVTQPTHGTLSGTAPNVTYTPAVNYNGADSFTFRANDGKTNSAAATVSITVTPVNDAPSVAIASPTNGATFTTPTNITIQATALDIDGTIAKVEFYNGPTNLGQATTSPYQCVWSNVAAGTYTLTARATDNQGAVTTSAGVTIMVNPPVNQPPVALAGVDPINGTTLDEYYFWGTDSYDPDGVVTSYQWTVNSEEVSTQTEFLYSFPTTGVYNVTLTVWDNKGASDSDLVQVRVTEPAVTVSVEVPDGMTGEPGLAEGTGTIRVKRTGSTSASLTLNVALSGDAVNGVDYATVASSVVIPVGATYRDVTISPLADASDESDEMVILTVLSGTGYTVDSGTSAGLVLIKDQTYGTPVVSAEATDVLAKEPMQTTDKGAIKVSRTGSCHAALTVYCTLGGTAVNGVDYSPVPVPVVLAVGQSSKVLTIAPLADGVVESNETVVLTLTANAAYQIAAGKGMATVTIQDATVLTTPVVSVVATDADAQEPAGGVLNYGYIRFARTTRFHETLTVNCTVGGTASNGVDYAKVTVPIVFAVGEGIKDVSIRPMADSVTEGVETAVFTLATGTGYTVDAGKASATVNMRE